MKRAGIRGFFGVFTPLGAILVIILFSAIICIPVCVVGIVHKKAGAQIPLLSVTVAECNSSTPTPEQSEEWETIRMRVTAYCPCEKCCGKHSDGRTACLHKIRHGDVFVAADEEYCFGTEMLVAGYNNGEPVKVLDRGGAIYENRLDVFFNSHEEALKWGVKYLDVKVRRSPKATQ